jgi:vacuolar-type H+-ATPase subunit H
MKEIVDKILKEEQLAQERVESAKKESDLILQKARKEAKDMQENIEQELADLAQMKKESASDGFLKEKAQILNATRADISAKTEAKKKDIPVIARRVFDQSITIQE